MNIDKNNPISIEKFKSIISEIPFHLPDQYLEFMKESNGADFTFDESYLILWPLTDLIKLNKAYSTGEFIPDFYLIGSDGGDTAYAVSKKTGGFYKMPFIGISKKEACFISDNFNGFLSKLSR
jgi:hypothetical protein